MFRYAESVIPCVCTRCAAAGLRDEEWCWAAIDKNLKGHTLCFDATWRETSVAMNGKNFYCFSLCSILEFNAKQTVMITTTELLLKHC